MAAVDKIRTGRQITIKSIEEVGGAVPEGKEFVEWSTEPNGAGVHYSPGQRVRVLGSFSLYPVFRDVEREEGASE